MGLGFVPRFYVIILFFLFIFSISAVDSAYFFTVNYYAICWHYIFPSLVILFYFLAVTNIWSMLNFDRVIDRKVQRGQLETKATMFAYTQPILLSLVITMTLFILPVFLTQYFATNIFTHTVFIDNLQCPKSNDANTVLNIYDPLQKRTFKITYPKDICSEYPDIAAHKNTSILLSGRTWFLGSYVDGIDPATNNDLNVLQLYDVKKMVN